MQFLAITYHYLGDYNVQYLGINSLSAKQFQEQIEALGRYFEFISQDDLLGSLQNNTMLPEKSCFLTFDDGVKSQYEVAVPVLEKMKVPAVFFLCGLPYDQKKVLNIHKIHWLRSILSPDIFLEKIISNFDFLGFKFSQDMISDEKIQDKFFWDDIPTRKVKYLLNVVLPYSTCKQCIDMIFAEHVSSESKFCADFYMSKDQVRDLHQRFAVGVHSYSHMVLGKMSEKSIEEEIKNNIDVVTDIIDDRPVGISYPYGYKEAVTPLVAEVAKKIGLSFGFTVERSVNVTLEYPLLFARIDTNDALRGKKSLFNIDKGNFQVSEPMTYSRRRYFTEKETGGLL